MMHGSMNEPKFFEKSVYKFQVKSTSKKKSSYNAEFPLS